MKYFLLSFLLASVALAQSRSFYTDRPDVFGNDLSLGAGGSASSPTRTANSTKWFTFNLPTYAASTGRGSLAMIRASDDGTDRSLYLGNTTNGLTDFRIYGCTYAGSPALYFLISPSGTVTTYSTTVIGGLLRPEADGTRDLGSGSFSWKDIWLDGNVKLGASGNLNFQGRGIIESPSSTTIALRNATSGNMTRVLFGTADSSGPALSFSGTTLQATDGVGGLVSFSANSIELSHASANTLTASGGVLSIEGVKVNGGEFYEVALSDETTAITTGTAKVTVRAPFAMTVTGVRASLSTVSSSGTPTVDINEGGTTILSTKLTIDASEKTSTTAATAAVISDSAIADDAEITFDIDTAGTGAAGLKVRIYYTR